MAALRSRPKDPALIRDIDDPSRLGLKDELTKSELASRRFGLRELGLARTSATPRAGEVSRSMMREKQAALLADLGRPGNSGGRKGQE